MFNVSPQDDMEYNVPVLKTICCCPITIAQSLSISAVKSNKFLKFRLESGASKPLIIVRVIPRVAMPKRLASNRVLSTIAGYLLCSSMIKCCNVRLHEFDKNCTILEHNALMFDVPTRYDLILGSDILAKTVINLNYVDGTMDWLDLCLPMCNPYTECSDFEAMTVSHLLPKNDDFISKIRMYAFLSSHILDAKYEELDIKKFLSELAHLNDDQKDNLLEVMFKHESLFDGTLGV